MVPPLGFPLVGEFQRWRGRVCQGEIEYLGPLGRHPTLSSNGGEGGWPRGDRISRTPWPPPGAEFQRWRGRVCQGEIEHLGPLGPHPALSPERLVGRVFDVCPGIGEAPLPREGGPGAVARMTDSSLGPSRWVSDNPPMGGAAGGEGALQRAARTRPAPASAGQRRPAPAAMPELRRTSPRPLGSGADGRMGACVDMRCKSVARTRTARTAVPSRGVEPPLTGAPSALGRHASALAGPAESRVGLARQAARVFRHAGATARETVRRSMEKGKEATARLSSAEPRGACAPLPCAPPYTTTPNTPPTFVWATGARGSAFPRLGRGRQVACTCRCVNASRTPPVGRAPWVSAARG